MAVKPTTGITRREMLASFLGLPAAVWACNSRRAVSTPDGEIVGASDQVGHRLMRATLPVPGAQPSEERAVVIVGGGVAGLSAAWRLARSGFRDFELLELEPAPGGTSRAGDSRLVSYPWGAHYVPAPTKENTELVSLLEEMAVIEGRDEEGEPIVAEQFLCRDPQERVFFRGRWYEGLYLHAGADQNDIRQLNEFTAEIDGWVAWRDGKGRRAFSIPMATGSDDPEVTGLDRMTMAEWMDQHGWDSPRLRWLVDYSCRDDYGMTPDQTSAWAGLFYFASRVREPGVESQPLITWPEGNGRLVAHLFNTVRDRVRLGYAVTSLIPFEEGTRRGVDVVAMDSAGSSVLAIRARRVIFAAPHFLTRFMIRPWIDDPPGHVGEFEYGAWLVANLRLRDRPEGLGFPLAWDNVIYESRSLGYVVATHQRGLDRGPTILTYYDPLADQSPSQAREWLLGMDHRGLAELVLADLSRAHPGIGELTERLDVMRWGHAMIRPRPGFIWGGARRAAARPYRGIHFAHSDLSGIALFEEAFHQGLRAADEVLSEMRSIVK